MPVRGAVEPFQVGERIDLGECLELLSSRSRDPRITHPCRLIGPELAVAHAYGDRYGSPDREDVLRLPGTYDVTDQARVATCVADLVEAAKIKALDELGDGRAAVARAIRWLAPRLGAGSPDVTL